MSRGTLPAIGVELRESGAEKALLRGDNRNINERETNGQHQRDRPTEQRHGKAGGDKHGAQVERVAGVRVGAGRGEFAVLFHVACGVGAQPKAGQHQRQAPGNGGGLRRAPPEFEQIERGGQKAERNADAAGDALPARDPVVAATAFGRRLMRGSCRSAAGHFVRPASDRAVVGGVEHVFGRDGQQAGLGLGTAGVVAEALGTAQHLKRVP